MTSILSRKVEVNKKRKNVFAKFSNSFWGENTGKKPENLPPVKNRFFKVFFALFWKRGKIIFQPRLKRIIRR